MVQTQQEQDKAAGSPDKGIRLILGENCEQQFEVHLESSGESINLMSSVNDDGSRGS